jgi:ubiquinone/menaquinone biosynthesis C-methylase UbiE
VLTQAGREQKDRHLPTVMMDNFIRRLLAPPKKKISGFIRTGSVVADLGCGPGYFTIPMAELVGDGGKVYAVDSDLKLINALQAKSAARGLQNVIEAHTASAADMEFTPDGAVDFVFANGLLCCMADHMGAVEEIKRVLKPCGRAYISVTKVLRKSDSKSVRREEWDQILEGFSVEEKHEGLTNRWAIIAVQPNVAG